MALRERKYADIKIGDKASFSKTISEYDIYTFAGLTGDFNPIHVNAEAAKKSLFKERIAHGFIGVSFISNVLGTDLPGPGTIYLSQEVFFKAPVKIGETLTVVCEVIEKR
ncbi:MAG: MaoC family dehydratase, partial [Planctomycetota bacterium]